MARYHGYRGQLYLSTSGSSAATPVASIKSASFSFPKDKADVTAFGDRHMNYRPGLQDPKGKISALFDDSTLATLKSADASADGAKFYAYFSRDVASRYVYGTAILDVGNINWDVKGPVTVDLELAPFSDDWDYKAA